MAFPAEIPHRASSPLKVVPVTGAGFSGITMDQVLYLVRLSLPLQHCYVIIVGHHVNVVCDSQSKSVSGACFVLGFAWELEIKRGGVPRHDKRLVLLDDPKCY